MEVGLEHLKLGIITPSGQQLSPEAARALAEVTKAVIYQGGYVVVPQCSKLSHRLIVNRIVLIYVATYSLVRSSTKLALL